MSGSRRYRTVRDRGAHAVARDPRRAARRDRRRAARRDWIGRRALRYVSLGVADGTIAIRYPQRHIAIATEIIRCNDNDIDAATRRA
jgi:hypothetical protein